MQAKRSSLVHLAAGRSGGAAVAAASGASATPVQRQTVDQKGDFVVFGNTAGLRLLRRQQRPGAGAWGPYRAPAAQNADDTSPDVFWRSDDATAVANAGHHAAATARSTAVLSAAAGRRRHLRPAATGAAPAAAPSPTPPPLSSASAPAPSTPRSPPTKPPATATTDRHTYYQSTANITSLVQLHGAGAYRVGGIDAFDCRPQRRPHLRRLDMVVFYRWTPIRCAT